MKKLFMFVLLLMAAQASYAQFHYKGLQGVFLEYGLNHGIEDDFDTRYSAGYSKFLGRSWQLMINAEYATNTINHPQVYQYYHLDNRYKVDVYSLAGQLNYSFLRIAKFIYLNAGLGPRASVQHFRELVGYSNYSIDYNKYVESEQKYEIDPHAVRRRDAAFKVGAMGTIGAEIYLGRHFNLMYRYNLSWIFKSNLDTWNDYQLVGIRYNFR